MLSDKVTDVDFYCDMDAEMDTGPDVNINYRRTEDVAQRFEEFQQVTMAQIADLTKRMAEVEKFARGEKPTLSLDHEPAAAQGAIQLASPSSDTQPKLMLEKSKSFSDTERPLTRQHLDRGDMCPISESVWDSMLFVGLEFTGPLGSSLIVVIALINAFLQFLFCYIAYTKMSDPAVSADDLVGMLRFRAGAAHSVKWADSVNRRSMISQVCETDQKTHLSGAQLNMYDNLSAFSDGGHILSILVQFCWFIMIFQEILGAIHFCKAIWSAHRGATRIVTDGVVDGDQDDVESMVLQQVVARIKEISTGRKLFMTVCSFLPRVSLACLLWFCGVRFILTSDNHGDLVLNFLALAFILDLDEVFYEVFMTRRIKALVSNLEELPVRPHRIAHKVGCSGVSGVAKFAITTGAVVAVNYFLISPLFANINEAQVVLCGGVQNFVYAENPLTSSIHAARTLDSVDANYWSQSERDVLQLAQPDLNERLWPTLPQDVFDLVTSTYTRGKIHPYHNGTMATQATIHKHFYATVDRIQKATAEEAADWLDCQDLINAQSPQVAIDQLRLATEDNTVNGCDDVLSYCHRVGQDAVRALCPLACGCATQIIDQGEAAGGSLAGFFGAPRFGCPAKCVVLGEAGASFVGLSPQPVPCSDVPAYAWESLATVPTHPAKLYFTGLFTYLTVGDSAHVASYVQMICEYMTYFANDYFGLLANNVPIATFVAGFMNGTVEAEYQTFQWNLYPGVPHPRGLTGCAFFSSFEITAILGLSLCDVGQYRSLRYVCPTSCGCYRNNNSGQECPASCADPTS